MSDEQLPGSLEGGAAGDGAGGMDEMAVEQPRRAASIQLTSDVVRERRAASFEAARTSLSEALGITYRILQVGVVLLVGLFLLSGFQQVDESERGVRVQFGRVAGQDLEPGFHFSLPQPIGGVRKIGVGAESITLDDVFFERLTGSAALRPYSEASGKRSLQPGVDGSLITADGNLVHMRLSVTYRRSDVAAYIGGLRPEAELTLVRSLVQRATVGVVAETTVDSIVGGVSLEGGVAEGVASERLAVQARIERLSQELVDDLSVGLRIESVTVTEAYVPGQVGREFRQVSTAVSEARGAVEQAQATREERLTGAAGSGYGVVLELLDEYERLVDLGEGSEAERLLGVLYGLFDGAYEATPLVWDGTDYGTVRLGGEAAALMAAAGTYEARIVSGAESQARLFEAKLEAYRENPEFFVAREWADAMRGLMASDISFEVFSVPSALRQFRLMINEDPRIRDRLEQQRNLQERIDAERRRNEAAGLEFEG